MCDKKYNIKLEISGPSAMWTRPDSGDTAISYPAPTSGAVKGIFESILLSNWAEIVPTKCEICSPIIFHTYNTNYGGPLRKSDLRRKGASFQQKREVLLNVCYRIYARFEPIKNNYHLMGKDEQKRQKYGTTNGPHACQEIFNRRIKRGQFYHTPFLGIKEFAPDYVGLFRDGTKVQKDINIEINSMLLTTFNIGPDNLIKQKRDRGRDWDPVFRPASIVEGVLRYV